MGWRVALELLEDSVCLDEVFDSPEEALAAGEAAKEEGGYEFEDGSEDEVVAVHVWEDC